MFRSAVAAETPAEGQTSKSGSDTGEVDLALALLSQQGVESSLLEDRWFKAIVANLPAAVYTTNADGHLTYFNQAAARLAGRPKRAPRRAPRAFPEKPVRPTSSASP